MGNSFKKKEKNESKDSLLLDTNKSTKNEENNYKEYFKLINQKLRRFYVENQNNQFNISLSLDKKDFNTITTAKKISINPSQKFIYWKDYLINYLNKQVNKGVGWANDLMELVKGEIFLSENKWLSLFFWQEFEMRTKPKCLINLQKNNENSTDSNSSEHILGITDRLNGSFVSINTDELSLNDPTHEYKEYRNKVKAYINIFKEHVFDPDHPINIVARFFLKTFSSYILEKMKELYSLRNANDPEFNKTATIVSDDITKSLQKFLLKLQTSLRLMYSKTVNYQCFIEEKDEFINLVTNLVFRDGTLYNDIYELFKISLYDQMKVLENKFNQLKGLKPEDLGIHEKFCLNETTLNFQKKLLQDNKHSLSIIQKSENLNEEHILDNKDLMRKIDDLISDAQGGSESFAEISPHSNATMKLNIKESIASHDKMLDTDMKMEIFSEKELKTPQKEIKIYSESDIMSRSIRKNSSKRNQNFSLKYKQGSYDQAIRNLKSISRYKVPFEKLILIATISSEVTECVNYFWKDFEKIITTSLLNIDADELMTIFIFIIIKSQMTELLIHSKFIKEFTTSTTRSTMMGYYYTTLEASLIYILTVREKSDLLNRDKIRQSLVPNKTSFIVNENEEFTMLAINSNIFNSSHSN